MRTPPPGTSVNPGTSEAARFYVIGCIRDHLECAKACISTAQEGIRECKADGGNRALLPHWRAMLKRFQGAKRDLEALRPERQRRG